jgi:3-methyl-2-oxobutanoate hydroxymethyltransferase
MLKPTEIAVRKSPPLVVATAYDFPFARMLEAAGVDVILVGDSLANVVLGLASTRGIGMEEMALFTAAAVRGAGNTHVVADMPAGSYDTPEFAVANARRFLSLGAASVKLEGPQFEVVRSLTAAGIPVMGHLGVLPQTAESFRPVGKSSEERERLIREAKGLQEAGVFAMVLENVNSETAQAVTESVSVPTIGIGSGKHVSGQVQVLHDLLGLSRNPPPFAKAFVKLEDEVLRGIKAYAEAVRRGEFPAK